MFGFRIRKKSLPSLRMPYITFLFLFLFGLVAFTTYNYSRKNTMSYVALFWIVNKNNNITQCDPMSEVWGG